MWLKQHSFSVQRREDVSFKEKNKSVVILNIKTMLDVKL